MIWQNELAAIGTLAVLCLAIVCWTVYACIRETQRGRNLRSKISCGVYVPEESEKRATKPTWWRESDNEKVLTNPDACPYCNSTDTYTDSSRISGGTVRLSCGCSECGRGFTNQYEYETTLIDGE